MQICMNQSTNRYQPNCVRTPEYILKCIAYKYCRVQTISQFLSVHSWARHSSLFEQRVCQTEDILSHLYLASYQGPLGALSRGPCSYTYIIRAQIMPKSSEAVKMPAGQSLRPSNIKLSSLDGLAYTYSTVVRLLLSLDKRTIVYIEVNFMSS